MGETQTRSEDFLRALNPAEDKLKIVTRKAKVLIVCLDEDGDAGIFVPMRSLFEDTRIFEPDLPGGTIRLDQDPKEGVIDETGNEFRGLKLFNIKVVNVVEKIDPIPHDYLTIVRKVTTTVLAANAHCDPEGISMGVNEKGVREHCGGGVVKLPRYSSLFEMQSKYRKAPSTDIGQIVIPRLVPTAEPMIIPPELKIDWFAEESQETSLVQLLNDMPTAA